MIHPLLSKLVTQPELFVEHADSFGELASIEVRDAVRSLRSRVVLFVLAGACAIGALGLAGMAILLAAAIPVAEMSAPALLIIVPLVALAAAVACAWFAWRAPARPFFAHLREQWEADRKILRDLGRDGA